MFNRLSLPKKMAEFLTNTGCNVILIDNGSTYPPLLEWYKSCPYKIHFMEKNYGHLVFWKSGLFEQYSERYYVVTDHDLDLTGLPTNYIDILMAGLENNPDVIKSGLSLRIDDLPDNPFAKEAYDWELKFWQTKQDNLGFYKSSVDTTFALYDTERKFSKLPPESDRFFDAVRSPEPYVIRHCLWYETLESIENNPEEKYYFENTHTYWAGKMKELL